MKSLSHSEMKKIRGGACSYAPYCALYKSSSLNCYSCTVDPSSMYSGGGGGGIGSGSTYPY